MHRNKFKYRTYDKLMVELEIKFNKVNNNNKSAIKVFKPLLSRYFRLYKIIMDHMLATYTL